MRGHARAPDEPPEPSPDNQINEMALDQVHLGFISKILSKIVFENIEQWCCEFKKWENII